MQSSWYWSKHFCQFVASCARTYFWSCLSVSPPLTPGLNLTTNHVFSSGWTRMLQCLREKWKVSDTILVQWYCKQWLWKLWSWSVISPCVRQHLLYAWRSSPCVRRTLPLIRGDCSLVSGVLSMGCLHLSGDSWCPRNFREPLPFGGKSVCPETSQRLRGDMCQFLWFFPDQYFLMLLILNALSIFSFPIASWSQFLLWVKRIWPKLFKRCRTASNY